MKMQVYIDASPKIQSFYANLSKSHYDYKKNFSSDCVDDLEMTHDHSTCTRQGNDNSPSPHSTLCLPNKQMLFKINITVVSY